MPTGYYLLDNPQRTPQCRAPRWERMTGTVGVHVTASAADKTPPDTGPENTARFICNRGDYGSYHELVGFDVVIPMAPDHFMTWHTAAANLNGAAWGISIAALPTDFDPDDPWTQNVIRLTGERIRAFWERNGYDVAACARWLTKDEAWARVPGLYHHGDAQPWDRSDAWARVPARPALDQMLLDAILGAPSPTPEPPEDPMPTADEIAQAVIYQGHEIARDVLTGGVYVRDLIGYRRVHLETPEAVVLSHVQDGVRFHGGTPDTCNIPHEVMVLMPLDGDDLAPGSSGVDLGPILQAIAETPGATVDELLARLAS